MPVPKIEDIKIPELPANTAFKPPEGRQFAARLQLNGKWYEFYEMGFREDTQLNTEVRNVAQQLVYVKFAELEQYRLQLERTKKQIEQAQAALQATAEPPFPTPEVAASGLQIWKSAPGTYMMEKPVTYFPQHIVRRGGGRQLILGGQFKPRMVMAQAMWYYPSGGINGFKLVDMNTGSGFMHYHTIHGTGGGDCTGDLPKQAKNYQELLRMFAMWEQQLQTITCEGMGEPPLHHPPGMPHIDQVKVVEQVIKDGGAWSTPKPSPAPSS